MESNCPTILGTRLAGRVVPNRTAPTRQQPLPQLLEDNSHARAQDHPTTTSSTIPIPFKLQTWLTSQFPPQPLHLVALSRAVYKSKLAGFGGLPGTPSWLTSWTRSRSRSSRLQGHPGHSGPSRKRRLRQPWKRRHLRQADRTPPIGLVANSLLFICFFLFLLRTVCLVN